MTMRISANRINMDDKTLQKPVLKDYGETVVTMTVSGSGYHLSFDGDNDYVELPAAPTPTSVLTLAAWVNYATGSESGRILDKGDLSSDPDGGVEWTPNGLDSNNHGGVSPDSLPPANQWVHLAVTFDSGTTRFYEDGAFVSEESAPFSTFDSGLTGDIWKIGRRANDNTADFTGKIDDVRMFSRVLSDGEIADIYEGTSVSDTNLEGWWEFDEGSGGTVGDSSANGRDGTRNGTTWVLGDGRSIGSTLDLTNGNIFDITLENSAAFTFANPPAAGTAGTLTTILRQDTTGGREVVWPAAVKWLGGEDPTLATDPKAVDILTFSTINGGSIWYGKLVGAYPEPPSVPNAPTSLSAIADDSEVNLSWSTPANGGSSAITGYKIYRGTAPSATTLIDTIGVTTSYTDSSLSNDTTYYYRVKAVNSVGEGVYSNEDSATPSEAMLVYLTSGTSWSVPVDWNSSNNTIRVIGGGGGGAGDSGAGGRGGGGGGAYSAVSNVTLTPGSTVTYQVGNGGTNNGSGSDTYLCNSTSGCASIAGGSVVVGAKGGSGAGSSTSGASGGSAGPGVGTTKYAGGDGGDRSSWGGGGGGGAAGPSGAGADGGGGGGGQGGAGGGGNGGGSNGSSSSSNGGDGGNNADGVGGGDGSTAGSENGEDGVDGGGGGGMATGSGSGGDAGNGGDGIDIDGTVGGGGGGGGGSDNETNNKPGDGGLYGGGGGGAGDDSNSQDGDGADGIIVIRYFLS